jgi:predicted glutamine amidotransferase
MCRLLGFAAPSPTTVADVLGGNGSRVFQDMALLHRDGWGTAWHRNGDIEAEVVARAGHDDPTLAAALGSDTAAARIVHLRLATQGMVCSPANTHPFVADGMAFAHNGSIKPTELIEPLISPSRAADLIGTTDSERYFAAILSRMDEGASAMEAAAETVEALRRRFPTGSLNALLLTGDALIAVHASEGVPIPMHEFSASGLAQHELPRHHVDAYYLMRMKRAADGSVVVASSGLDIDDWTPLPAESVTRIDLATLAVTTVPLRTVGEQLVA